MTKYRKLPVEIDAVQWTGKNYQEVSDFLLGTDDLHFWGSNNDKYHVDHERIKGGLIIETLEGEHAATINDFIIQGVSGEFYPCKPDIFAKTYEKV